MSDKPFFSIVTACKDGLEYLKETAPTIINQTFKDWEWIFLDDGSTENVSEYIKSLNDPRVVLIRKEKSVGQTKNLNEGIRLAKADWIARMDGDDLASLNKLELAYNQIKAQNGKIKPLLFSDFNIIDEKGSFISRIQFNHPLNSSFYDYVLNSNNPISHPTVVFYKYNPQKELYQYDENLRNAQDYELWKRILNDYRAEGWVHIPEPTISYRLVKESLSGAGAFEQKEELNKIRKNNTETTTSTKKKLNPEEQEGMQAFRILFFRFVGRGKKTNLYNFEDAKLLLDTLKYPTMFPKGLAYLALRPLKKALKKKMFNQIYS